ncbi:hypothetical protein RF11_09555 [Thelohanellus kitauei]|uniref:Uncharacterized protein n=1 Tax=Thelohanellus kitauei TaxID=669202 RepID=A0A0C2MX01_THEKT|nr:hypothetical protein RF11_09555 [Thelohanellus kitauei]
MIKFASFNEGNFLLLDHDFMILSSCRVRKVDGEVIAKANTKYDISHIRTYSSCPKEEFLFFNSRIMEYIAAAPDKTNLKKYISQKFAYFGAPLIEHGLSLYGYSNKTVVGVDFTATGNALCA